jgi:hypothetical protein
MDRKRKLRRRSEQYAEVKARNQKRKIRVRSLNSRLIRVRSLSNCSIKKLTVLTISYYRRWSYE